MNARVTQWAPVLSGVGALALVLALFLRWLAAGPAWLPPALAVLGVGLLAIYPVVHRSRFRDLWRARRTQAGANVILMSLLFVGIVGMVNYLGYRYHKRFDLTSTRQFSLSQQTLDILRNLPEPVHAVAVYTDDDPRRQRVEDLLREYAQVTDKFTYEFINPNREPAKARRLGITRLGVVLLLRGDRREEIAVLDEEDLTSGLIRVTRDKPRVVYFTTGHGERDPNAFLDPDYGQAMQALRREFYEVKTISLATITDTLPADMDALVVAGPRQPFAPEEIERLFDYLNSGGRVLLLVDPDPNLDIRAFNERLASWGIRLRNDLVIDPQSSFMGDIATPLVTRYTFHTITKNMPGIATFFPTVRSIERLDTPPEDKRVTVLITSSPNSWGETDYQAAQVRYDEGKDTRGPLNLAVAVEQVGEDQKRGRLVVVGDADFPSNVIVNNVPGAFGNVELLNNIINWLTEEEALVSIGPKPPAFYPLKPLTPGEQNVIFVTTTILLPLIILIAGLVVWWQRR